MAVLKFDRKAKLAATVMPGGYYSLQIVEIGEPTKSGSGKSFNMHSKFTVIDDEKYEGKELKIAFNTNMDQPSVMGSMYLMPHTFLPHLAAACMNISVDDVPEEFDTAQLKGMKFDGKVEKIISEGIVMNTISGFLPYGIGKQKEQEGPAF